MAPQESSADLAVVDALARLVLVARRAGLSIHVRGPQRLCRLAELAGLTDVLAGSEVCGQTEADEEPALGGGRVEAALLDEVVDVADPPA